MNAQYKTLKGTEVLALTEGLESWMPPPLDSVKIVDNSIKEIVVGGLVITGKWDSLEVAQRIVPTKTVHTSKVKTPLPFFGEAKIEHDDLEEVRKWERAVVEMFANGHSFEFERGTKEVPK